MLSFKDSTNQLKTENNNMTNWKKESLESDDITIR